MAFTVQLEGAPEIKKSFKKLRDKVDSGAFYQALVDAAIVVEGKEKEQLELMVYSRPEGRYHRTHDLFNTTQATGHVEVGINEVSTNVTSAKVYATSVHLGLGPNKHIGPRPFATEGLKQAADTVMQILARVLM